MQININTDALVKYTATLERLHKSALPIAIRKALNKTALDVKKNTMPDAAKVFRKRAPGDFFKANSKVDFADGFNIRSMHSKVGMFPLRLSGNNNYAVNDLEQQEHGGKIDKKSFIPLPKARTSGSINKMVRANARLQAIKKSKLINGKNVKGANWAQKAIKSAVHTGKKGFLLNPGRKGSVLWRIDSIRRVGGNTRFTKTKLYSFNKNRKVTIHKASHFMEKASMKSAQKMDLYFITEAKRQIVKYYSK